MNDASRSQIPSPQETLLLRAALLDGDAALDAYAAWKGAIDIDTLDGGSQRMLPLLAHNLARLGFEDELTPALHGHRRQALALNAHMIGTVRCGLRALDTAGIELMVLKGTALVASGLSELGLRPIGDVDVLVHPGDRARAIDVLAGDGWETSAYPAWYVKRVHADTVPAWVLHRGRVQLDLHWNALHLVLDPDAETPLWERAMTGSLGGERVLVPSIEDQAMQTWLHAAEHNPVPPLRWAADAVTAIQARGDDLGWDLIVDTAIAQHVVVPTRAALGYLARELDQPIPQAAIDRLAGARTSLLERREHAARNREPSARGRLDERIVELQDHRRRSAVLLARSPISGALDLRRQRRTILAGRELHDLRRGPLELDRERDPLDSLLHGWSTPESLGRWTDGPEAALAVRIEPGRRALLAADLAAFVGADGRRERIVVRVGGRRYATLRFDGPGPDLAAREIRIPVPPSPDGTAVISFSIDSPRSPASLGMSHDQRRLGLLLRRLWLDEPSAS